MFMAMEKGFFKSEGLELETVPMAGGAVIVQGVTSGDLQIGWTNVISLYQAYVEGFDFKLVAPGASNGRGKNESHAILVTKASPIKSAKDLEGKTVAVNTLNNIVHLMAMAWIAGVYGMNFALLPDEGSIGGFWFALGLMVVSAVGSVSSATGSGRKPVRTSRRAAITSLK